MSLLQDAINFGCMLITVLWTVLLAWWPAWMAVASTALLVSFSVATRRRRRALAVVSAAALVASAAGLVMICWWPASATGDGSALPRSLAGMLAVPLPLVALFVAVSVLEGALGSMHRPVASATR